MYDGFSAIWKKIGGGVMPGVSQGVLTPGVEYLLPSTVPGYQFKDMWESLCTGRKGDQFRNARITDLSKALENSYHAKKGSHVGGLKVFFEDMGQWGKDFYDKFLINDKTGDNTRKFLRAIADYRSDDSFQGANDAIPNRDQTIATLFETPLAKKTEVPGNIDKEMDTFNKSLKEAGYATLRILPAAGELGADVWKVTMDGVEYLFHLPKEILKSLTPEEVANLTKALKVLGVAGAVGAGVW